MRTRIIGCLALLVLGADGSPDGRYFFFTSFRGFGDRIPERPWTTKELTGLHSTLNGWGNVYQIDMASLRQR